MINPYIPNTASIPNIHFDYWMAKLTPGEFKVLMAIARKTYGWNKPSDKISLRQIEDMTGLARKSISQMIDSLVGYGLITKIKSKTEWGDDAPNLYEINVECRIEGEKINGGGSNLSTLGVGTSGNPQNPLLTKPNIQKKERKGGKLPLSELPFGRIASSFFAKLKELNPKIPKPNLQKWAKQLELLAQDGDGSTPEEIEKLIEYVLSTRDNPSSNGFCWANNILSPIALRKHYAKIWAEMSFIKTTKNNPDMNKQIAESISKKFPREDIVKGPDYIEFINGMYSSHIKFDDKEFKPKCLSELNKRKLKMEKL